MNIELYRTSSPTNKVIKNLTNKTDKEGSLKENCSLLNPIISIRNGQHIKGNYAFIPEFNRYYFITDKVFRTDGICELQLKCDVLMSFARDILASTQVVTRQANASNWKLPDEKLPINANNMIEGISFEGQVFDKNNYCYILSTIGRGSIT